MYKVYSDELYIFFLRMKKISSVQQEIFFSLMVLIRLEKRCLSFFAMTNIKVMVAEESVIGILIRCIWSLYCLLDRLDIKQGIELL